MTTRVRSTPSMTSLTSGGETVALLEKLQQICTSVTDETSVSSLTTLNQWLHQQPGMTKLNA